MLGFRARGHASPCSPRVLVDTLFIPNVGAFKEFVERVNTLLHFAVVANMASNDSCVFLENTAVRLHGLEHV